MVIANKKDLLVYSATELAGLAGASKASAARFFSRLGYAGFSDFRQQVRAQVSQQPLLAVDFRRRTSRLPRVVTAARSSGARVLLTDTPLSALASQAAAILHCPSQTEQVFDSYVSAVSLLNFLATTMAARAPKQARDRLSRIEQLHAALGDLETDS
jgi:DNA-binding MurR/RpiR family transcriptional regulator